MELKVQNLIKTDLNWRKTLEELSITIKEDENYLLLKYGIAADFANPIVQECRGLILNKSTWEVVCHSFDKFGNFGESYAPEIDWTTARCQAKMDGSLIKVWCDKGQWHVSTNGTIDAYKAELQQSDLVTGDCPYHTFGELFDAARQAQLPSYEPLDSDCTYSFELCSKYNKVVCQYGEPTIYHIGTRNNKTNEESNPDIGVQKPTEYPLHSLQDCIEAAAHLSYNEEGYVVVDANWNRIKVKSPTYIAAHYMKNNGQVSLKGLLQYYRAGDLDEFVTYAPEYAPVVTKLYKLLNALKEELRTTMTESKYKAYSRKDFALAVKESGTRYPDYCFKWYDGIDYTPERYLEELSFERFLKIVEARWDFVTNG